MTIEEIKRNKPDGALRYDVVDGVVWYFKYNDIGLTLINKGSYWQLCVPDVKHDIEQYKPL